MHCFLVINAVLRIYISALLLWRDQYITSGNNIDSDSSLFMRNTFTAQVPTALLQNLHMQEGGEKLQTLNAQLVAQNVISL
jgi:hypothetical protein